MQVPMMLMLLGETGGKEYKPPKGKGCTCRSCLIGGAPIGSDAIPKQRLIPAKRKGFSPCPDSCSTEPCGKNCKKLRR